MLYTCFIYFMNSSLLFATTFFLVWICRIKNLPVTRIVDHLMELKPSPETDDFRYFDPKLLKPTELGSNSAPRNRAPYQDAIVFMVGGGNYSEYQNLVDYAKVISILCVPRGNIY